MIGDAVRAHSREPAVDLLGRESALGIGAQVAERLLGRERVPVAAQVSRHQR